MSFFQNSASSAFLDKIFVQTKQLLSKAALDIAELIPKQNVSYRSGNSREGIVSKTDSNLVRSQHGEVIVEAMDFFFRQTPSLIRLQKDDAPFFDFVNCTDSVGLNADVFNLDKDPLNILCGFLDKPSLVYSGEAANYPKLRINGGEGKVDIPLKLRVDYADLNGSFQKEICFKYDDLIKSFNKKADSNLKKNEDNSPEKENSLVYMLGAGYCLFLDVELKKIVVILDVLPPEMENELGSQIFVERVDKEECNGVVQVLKQVIESKSHSIQNPPSGLAIRRLAAYLCKTRPYYFYEINTGALLPEDRVEFSKIIAAKSRVIVGHAKKMKMILAYMQLLENIHSYLWQIWGQVNNGFDPANYQQQYVPIEQQDIFNCFEVFKIGANAMLEICKFVQDEYSKLDVYKKGDRDYKFFDDRISKFEDRIQSEYGLSAICHIIKNRRESYLKFWKSNLAILKREHAGAGLGRMPAGDTRLQLYVNEINSISEKLGV